MSNKLYAGNPDESSEKNVWVFDGQAGTSYDLPLRLDLHNHSPTGFAWGYGGSGPHQLALALLADATKDDKLALQYYHSYVIDVVSGLDMDKPWGLTQEVILAWVKKQQEAKQ